MKYIKIALILIVSLLGGIKANAQLDTKHYIPPMYARQDPADGTNEDIYLVLSTPQVSPFDVTITDGAGTVLYTGVTLSRSAPVTLALSNAAGSSKGVGTKFLVPASNLATVVSDEGIILSANKAFFVNLRVDEGAQAAALTTKGSAALGTEFRSGHVWNNTTNSSNVFDRKAHIISFIASEDDTEVTVSDFGSVDFENINEGSQPVSGEITVSLNAGQSYVLAAFANVNAANVNDVNGTRISSTKPITVNSGSWLGGNPIDGNLQGRDIGIDQIASLEETGFEYIMIKGQGIGNESAIVIASIDGTQIFLNGNTTPAATLNGGDYHRFSSSDFTAQDNMHISSNQPVYVYQNVNGSSSSNERQNGLNFIPPVVCLGGTDVDIADANFTGAFGGTINSAILIIGEKNVDVTITDGGGSVTTLTAADANAVTGNSNYVTYKSTGYSGNITVASARPIRVALTIESGNVGAAGFFSGFTTAPVVESPNGYDATACIPENVPVELTAAGFDSYQWFRNGVKLNGETNANIFVDAPGQYSARGILSGCQSSEQSFELEIALCPADVGIAKNEVSVDNVTGSIFDVTYDLYLENFSNVNDADNVQIIEDITDGLPSGATASLQTAPQVVSGTFSQGGINPAFDGSTVTQMLLTSTETKIDPSNKVTIRFVIRIDMSSASTPTYSNQAVVSTKDVGPNDGSNPDQQDFSTSGTDPDPDGNGDPTDTDENETTQTCVSNTTISYSSPTYYTTGSDPTPSVVGVSGGDFTTPSSSITLNVTTGEIDLSQTVVGTYTITYSFGGLCPVTTDVTIALNPPAEPTVVSQTANTFTPTIMGSAVVEASETLFVTVEGQTYELGVDPELTISGTTWSLALPAGVITSGGTYDVDAIIDDGAGGTTPDTTSGELFIDSDPPSVDIQGEPSIVNSSDPYTVTIQFSEDIVAFDITDINIGNGSTSSLIKIDDNTYTVVVTPDGMGDITIDIPAGAAQDAAGNSSTVATQAVTVYDIVPPTVPTVVSQNTSNTTPVITGTTGTGSALAAGETMTVVVNGATYTVTPDASGNWSVDTGADTPSSGTLGTFGDGTTYQVVATTTDSAGNTAVDASTNELIIDTTPPTTPTVNTQTTNDTTPIITGATGTGAALAAGETMTVVVNGATYTVTPDASGDWSVDTGADTPSSGTLGTFGGGTTYQVVATTTDSAGNTAVDASTNELIIDTTPPTTPTVNTQTTNDTTPVITGATGTGAALAAGETMTVVVNGATYTVTPDASGNWSVDTSSDTPSSGTLGTFSDGNTYQVVTTTTDSAGNTAVDASTDELIIDTSAPAVPTVANQTTNDTTPVLTGTAEAGSTVTIVVGGATFTVTADGSGDWALDTGTTPDSGTFAPNVNGTNEVAVTSTDAAGNSTNDATTLELTIDTSAPVAPTVDELSTTDTTPVLTGTAEPGSTVTVVLNGTTFTTIATAGGTWSIDTETDTPTAGGPFVALTDGDYNVAATSTDAAGNSTSETTVDELTIDNAAPPAPTVDPLSTTDTTPVLTGTAEPGSTVTVVLNGTTFTTTATAGGTWSVNTETDTPTAGGPFTPLTDGDYNVAATSTDAAGNSTSETNVDELTIDNVPPTAPTVATATTNDTTPVISGTSGTGAALAAGETMTVVVNGATYTVIPDASGNWSVDTQTATPSSGTLGVFNNGTSYEVVATVTDAAGNATSDSSSNELAIDTTPPTAPTVVSQTTNDTTPTITGTTGTNAALVAGETMTVLVNGATYTVTPDASGNWSVDTGADTPSSGTLGTFTNGSTYGVTSKVTDAGGNSTSDATSNEVIIDTTPPTAPTVASQTSNSTTPTITGTTGTGAPLAPGETLTVEVNGATYSVTPDASGNWSIDTGVDTPSSGTLGTFSDGTTYQVVATTTDSAGNSATDAGANELIIDTTPPNTPTVVTQTTNDTTPTITGTTGTGAALAAGETMAVTVNGATYNVTPDASGNWSVDTGVDTPASGTLGTFSNGNSYNVASVVTDTGGNTATDISSSEVTIDTAPPATPTVANQATNDTTPTITGTTGTGTALAPGETMEVTVNGATYTVTPDASGNWSVDTGTATPTSGTLGTFVDGSTYNIDAVVTDEAGNTSTDASAGEITIDTTAPTTPTVTSQTTNDTTPTITGTTGTGAALVAGETMTVLVNGATYTVTPDASGNWSIDTGVDTPSSGTLGAFTNGTTYDVAATVTDAANNSTTDSSSSELIIDTTAPIAPTVDALVTNDTTPTITGTTGTGAALAPGETMTVVVNGATYTVVPNASGIWSIDTGSATPTSGTLGSFTNGSSYEVGATVVDAGGNSTSDASTNEVEIDTTSPTIPTANSQTTNDTTPTITGTTGTGAALAAGETMEVTVNGATYTVTPDASGNWSVDTGAATPSSGTLGTFNNGSTYQVISVVTDEAGNTATDIDSNELIIDTAPPTVPTVNALTTNDSTPTITGTTGTGVALAPGETMEVTINGATYTVTPDASGNWSVDTGVETPSSGTLGTFTDGTSYEVAATVTDAGGNSTSDGSTNELSFDTTPPVVPTVVSQTTNDITPTITGTTGTGVALEAGETMTVQVNGATYTVTPNASGNWSVDTGVQSPSSGTLGTFNDGDYEVISTVTDAGGNSTADVTTNELTIDTVPTIAFVSSSNPTTCGGSQGTMVLNFTNVPNGTYTLNYNDATPSAQTIAGVSVSSGSATVTGLTAGSYNDITITVSGKTSVENIDVVLTDPNPPTVALTSSSNPTSCAGTDGTIDLFFTGVPNGTYVINYHNGTSAQTISGVAVSANAATITGLSAGTYNDMTVTVNGCTSIENIDVVLADPNPPTIAIASSTNPATCGANGSIGLTFTGVPDGTYTIAYATGTFTNVSVSSNAATISAPQGTYNDLKVTVAGCVSVDDPDQTLNDPATATIAQGTVTGPTTCSGTDGSIQLTGLANSTTYTVSYSDDGTAVSVSQVSNASGQLTIAGLNAGSYTNIKVTATGCTSNTLAGPITLSDPPTANIAISSSSSPTTCAGSDGQIVLSGLSNNTGYAVSYKKDGTTVTTSITSVGTVLTIGSLTAGNYTDFQVTAAGCASNVIAGPVALTNPSAPSIATTNATDPSACGTVDGQIELTGLNNALTYDAEYTYGGSTTSLTGLTPTSGSIIITPLAAGTYTNISVEDNSTGCQSNIIPTIVLNPPDIAMGTVVNPTTCAGTEGSIQIADLGPGVTYFLDYELDGTSVTQTSFTADAGGKHVITGLGAGAYTNITVTNNSCISNAISTTLSDPATPTFAVGTLTDPTTCGGSDGSIQLTGLTASSTYTVGYTGASVVSVSKVADGSGNITITGLDARAYTNITVTINACISGSSTATLNDPATPTIALGTSPEVCSGVTSASLPYSGTAASPDQYSIDFDATAEANGFVDVSLATLPVTPINMVVPSGASPAAYNATLTVTNSTTTCVSSSQAFTITVNGLPSVGLSVSDPTVCSGENAIITLSNSQSGINYQLRLNSDDSNVGTAIAGTGTDITFTIAGATTTTTYNVLATNATSSCGAELTDKAIVTVNNGSSAAALTGTATICNGESTNISVAITSGTSPYVVVLSDGTTVNNYTSGSAISVAPISTTAYTITSVTDANGCTGSGNTGTATVTVNEPASSAVLSGTTAICNGESADLSVAITGGTGPFTIGLSTGATVNGYTAGSAISVSPTATTTYSITSVTDANGCAATAFSGSATVTVTNVPTIAITSTSNPTTCAGTGSMTLSFTNVPNGNYTITYATGSFTNVSVSGNAATVNAGAGTYTDLSIAVNGCVSLQDPDATLLDPPTATIAATVTNPTTCGGSNGSISLSGVENGTTYNVSYTYATATTNTSIVSGGTGNALVIAGLAEGDYTNISVEAAGCPSNTIASTSLVDPTPVTLAVGAGTNPGSCSGADGSIALSGLTASTNYTLAYSKNATVLSKAITADASGNYTLSGLTSGTYENFSVTNSNCTSNVVAGPVNLIDPSAPTVVYDSDQDPASCSSTDGFIILSSLTVGDDYVYSYTKAGSTITGTLTADAAGKIRIENLPAGTYSNIFVDDAITGCQSNVIPSIVLNPPDIALGTTVNATTCSGTEGSIQVTGLGASTAYDLDYNKDGTAVTTASITADASGNYVLASLTAGAYTDIRLTNNGCVTNLLAATLTEPTPATIAQGTVTNPTTCAGTNGSIQLTGLAASTAYTVDYEDDGTTVSVSLGANASGIITIASLDAGAYTNISVTRTNCQSNVIASITITDPVTPVITLGTDPEECSGITSTSISYTFTTGTPNQYTLDFDAAANTAGFADVTNGTLSGGTIPMTIGTSVAGTYNAILTVSDNSTSCTSTNYPVSITVNDTPTITLNANPEVCQGATTAALGFSGTTGSPDRYTLDFNAAAESAGFADVVLGTLGTSPINVPVPSGVSAGTFNATLVVSNASSGCLSTSNSVAIVVNTKPGFTLGTSPVVCAGETSADLNYSALVGAPDEYEISFNTTAQGQGFANVAFTALPASPIAVTVPVAPASGTYTGTISMRNSTSGCVSNSKTFTVKVNDTPDITLGANPTACKGATSTSISYSGLSGGANQYSIDFDGAANTAGFSDVANSTLTTSPLAIAIPSGMVAGTYNATLTVNNSGTSCVSSTKSFTITVNDNPIVTLGTSPEVCVGETVANLGFTTSVGSPDTYSIDFNTVAEGQGFVDVTNAAIGTSPIAIVVPASLSAATYSATIVFNNSTTGCASTVKNFTVKVNATPTVSLGTNPTICEGETTGAISYSAVTGSPNQYSIDFTDAAFADITNQAITSSPLAFAIPAAQAAGTYAATLTVSNGTTGCISQTYNFNLVVKTTPVITSSNTNPTTCAGTDGTITLSGLDNTVTYAISYSKDGSPVTSSATPAGGDIVLNNLPSGVYTNIKVTQGGCDSNVISSINLTDPSTANLTVASFDSNTDVCGSNGGGIVLSTGIASVITYAVDYQFNSAAVNVSLASDASGNISITGFAAGQYENFKVTAAGCESNSVVGPYNVTDPGTPLITYTNDEQNPTSCSSTDGFIKIGGLTTGTQYDYQYTKGGTTTNKASGGYPGPLTADAGGQITITALAAGSYTDISVEPNGTGCISNTIPSIVLNPPDIVLGTTVNPSSCSGTDGSFRITGLAASTTYDLDYDLDATAATTASITADASGEFNVTLRGAGAYTNIRVTNNSCVSNSLSTTLSDPASPVITEGTHDNPTVCGGNNGVIRIASLTTSTAYMVSYTFGGSVTTINATADGSGAIEISNLVAGDYTDVTASRLNCNSNTFDVTLSDPASASFSLTSSTLSECEGVLTSTLSYTVDSGTADTYSLDFSTSANTDGFVDVVDAPLSGGTITVNIPTSAQSTTYSVDVSMKNTTDGCASASQSVSLTINANPTITLSTSNPKVCEGITSANLVYTATTGTPDQYSITFDAAAIGDGFANVATTALSSSPISVAVPATANGVYNGTIRVTNSTTGCISETKAFTITVNDVPSITLGANPEVCAGETTALLTYSGATGSPSTYFINYDATAEGKGFVDVAVSALPGSPISLVVPSGATAGTYNATVKVSNGTTGCSSAALPFAVVINAYPVVPTVTTQISNSTTPTISGSAANGSNVTVTVGGATYTTVATATGWTIDTGVDTPTSGTFAPNTNGANEIEVSSETNGCAVSDTSTNELTIDTTDPVIPTVVSQVTNNPTPTLTGTAEAGSTVTVVVGGATFIVTADASGNWTVDTSATPNSGTFAPDVNGSNEVVVSSTDAAGNTTVDVTTLELTIDTSAPNIPTVASQTTNDTTPVITGTAEAGSTLTVVVGGATYTTTADASGNWSIDTETQTPVSGVFNPNVNGSNDVAITSTDAAGNSTTDVTSLELTIDTTAPSIPTVASQTTTDTTPVITGTAEAGSTVTVVVGGATYTVIADASGNWSIDTGALAPTSGTFNPNVNGANEVQVTSTDAAGNSTTDVTNLELIIDTTAPEIPTVEELITNNTTPTLMGTAEAGSTVTVVVGGATFIVTADASGNWSVDTSLPPVSGVFAPNVNGQNEVQVTSTDTAGNTTTDITNLELTIDTTDPSIPTVVSQTTSDTTPVITGTAEAGSTVTVTVGGATYTTVADASGNWVIDTETATPTSGVFAPNVSGTNEVVVTSTDAAGNSSTDVTAGELIINQNDAPVATTENITTDEDVDFSGTLLDNVSDVDGDNLSFTLVTTIDTTTEGVFTLNSDGTYTFAPADNFNGTLTLTYEVCDDGSPVICVQETINITVNAVNDFPIAVGETLTIDEGTTGTGTLVDNVTDVEGDNLTFSLVSGLDPSTEGTVTVNADGTYSFVPVAGFNGTLTFTYEVCDDGTPSRCSQATVTIIVNPVNDAPVALDDIAGVDAGGSVVIPVLGNDSDPEGNNLTVSGITIQPANGTVVINANGTITYTPNAGFDNGTDTFTYEVCDDGSPSACATATVTVFVPNQEFAPTAVDDVASVNEDGNVSGNVLNNDSDGNGDNLTVNTTPISGPTNGTLVLNADGTYTYTPDPDFSGTDTFVYEVCDDSTPSLCTQATVTITVNAVNDAPVASGETLTIDEDTSGNGDLADNVTDVEGDNLSFSLVSGPNSATEGTVTVNPDGTYTFVPVDGFNGTVTFTYEVCDDGSPVACSQAVVAIVVNPTNDTPVANDDQASVDPGNSVVINVLANDSDPEGDNLTVSIASGPANGTVVINADGTITYTPDVGFDNGTDTFTYEVCDDGVPSLCTTATVTVSVPEQLLAPVALDDVISVNEDESVTGNVLSNDSDGNGDILTVNTTPVSGPSNGMLVLNADGTYTYTPNPGFSGTDTFIYEVCDDEVPAQCDQATVTITVNPVNDPPVATPESITTDEDMSASGTLADNVTDEDSGNLSFSLVTFLNPATEGVFTLNSDGTYTFVPAENFSGALTLTYEVCDDGNPALCVQETITITVNPMNDAPVAMDSTIVQDGFDTITGSIAGLVSDPDGDPLLFSLVTGPTNGDLTLNADGTFTYIPENGFAGMVTFIYEVCDDQTPQECIQATVTITITATDTDGDGIIDDDEDLDGDGNLENDDCDEDGIPNYLDTDPCDTDGDGIDDDDEDTDGDGNPYNDDCDEDGIPNFQDTDPCDTDGDGLDDDEEDTDGDGNPYNDDCDNDGVPNFQDADPCMTVTPRRGFTPGGDGENDFFLIKDIENFPNNVVQIFNRWGNKLFEVDGYDNKNKVWRGEANFGVVLGGRDVPEGTYFYLIDLGDGSEPLSGFVVIKR